MSTFQAMYPGPCGDCPDPIQPDDEVVFVADVLVHATCQPSALRAEAALNKAPCPSCFIVPAVNGACGCDA